MVSCALDAGLVCQSISVTAQLLGIPENYSAAAILLVCYADTPVEETDGVTGATEWNPLDEQITYFTAE